MAVQPATVVDVHDRFAIVATRRADQPPCAACPGMDLCSTIPPEECEHKVRAVNRMGASIGDQVGLRLADERQLGAALFQAFGLPLGASLAGLAAGLWLGGVLAVRSSVASALGALGLLAGLVLWIPVGRRLDAWRKQTRLFLPEVAPWTPPDCRSCGSRTRDALTDGSWGAPEPPSLPGR